MTGMIVSVIALGTSIPASGAFMLHGISLIGVAICFLLWKGMWD
jgi:hypothetical protein